MTINLRQLYWTAGLLEGEGCFNLHWRVNLRGKRYGYPNITVAQKSPEILYILQEMFGGSVCKKQPCYNVWTFAGPPACGLMLMLWPLMSTKRQNEIRRCLAEQMSRKIGKRRAFKFEFING